MIIAQSHEEARETLTEMLVDAKFGEASKQVVVEQYLDGIELSVFVLTDGNSYKILPEAKIIRVVKTMKGLNTGGMGTVSPVPFADVDFIGKVEDRIVLPTVNGLKADEIIDYKGFIFAKLIDMGGLYMIEYNVQAENPETKCRE